MKPKILYTIILLHIIGFVYSQNWAVFNKDYRYNYSLENESYTTVVIFADSTLTQGADTELLLNVIAAGFITLNRVLLIQIIFKLISHNLCKDELCFRITNIV
jgi:hypothetical protein